MQTLSESFEYLPISHLNAYAYCPRRFYYEFTMGEMVINDHVLEGQQLHEHVDLPGKRTRDETVQMRRLYLCAPILGLVGYCDLVEIETSETGIDLKVAAKTGKIYPVEYKKGKMGKWVSDHVQLCAQALALEEVLQIDAGSISHGYVFYMGSARRDEVVIGETLRTTTLEAISSARHISTLDVPPPPITNWRKCRDCSLEPLCLPREVIAVHSQQKENTHGDTLSD